MYSVGVRCFCCLTHTHLHFIYKLAYTNYSHTAKWVNTCSNVLNLANYQYWKIIISLQGTLQRIEDD